MDKSRRKGSTGTRRQKTGRSQNVPVVQMYDGIWYRVKGYTYTECCDCALTHKEQYRLIDGHLEWTAVRDDVRTAERRKELGIKVTRKR